MLTATKLNNKDVNIKNYLDNSHVRVANFSNILKNTLQHAYSLLTNSLSNFYKRLKFRNSTPKSLYSRFLLITILPLLIIQIFSVFFFFERHWDSLSRNMINSLVGEVALITNGISNVVKEEREIILQAAQQYMHMEAFIFDQEQLDHSDAISDYEQLVEKTKRRLPGKDIALYEHSEDRYNLMINLGDGNGILNIVFSKKRIANPTTYIFILWLVGSTIVISLISILFLRNQVRSILNLSKAADHFGRGEEDHHFKPSGAKEIRLAGIAFIEMKERIKRLIDTRTQMLAGVSHDLRTPLTRIRLSTSMMEDKEKSQEIDHEVNEMEKMIDGYLRFAQVDSNIHHEENPEKLLLNRYINEIVESNRHIEANINIDIADNIFVHVRPDYFARAISNLLENASRYADSILIRAQKEEGKFLHIFIDDNGEGIAEEHLENVFQPFFRVDKSRNNETGGVGLGLSVTRDIIHKHGGDIRLSQSHLGGLKVTITFPIKD
jgi:two-component system osmolarity sensor histidine kinase EnvZ